MKSRTVRSNQFPFPLWQRAGVRKTLMAPATIIFRDGTGAMSARRRLKRSSSNWACTISELPTSPQWIITTLCSPSSLGDFSQKSYQLACLFARLLCCAKGYIARLCAPLRTLQADENPAQSGNFFRQFALFVCRRRSTARKCEQETRVEYG
jgi:hypothetical protein